MKNQKGVEKIKFNEEEIEWKFLMCNLRFILQTCHLQLFPPSIWWHITFPPFLMPITSCKFNISSNWMRNVDFFSLFVALFAIHFFHPSQFSPNYDENMFWNWKKKFHYRCTPNTWEMSLHIKRRIFILFYFYSKEWMRSQYYFQMKKFTRSLRGRVNVNILDIAKINSWKIHSLKVFFREF